MPRRRKPKKDLRKVIDLPREKFELEKILIIDEKGGKKEYV